MRRTTIIFFTTLIIALCAGYTACATAAGSGNNAPLWVTDTEAAYPDKDWLCFVESGASKAAAEAAALNALAQSVRVDVQSVTAASQSMVRDIQKNGGKAVSRSAEFASFTQEINAASSVQGLVGLERDFWTAKNGEVYALVRMNRAQCAARYQPLIAENEKLIALLLGRAEELRGTFDAYAGLALAVNAAELTDNYIAILTVLRPETAGSRPAYGSAGAVEARRRDEARSIAVKVTVRGDVDGRIEKAFAAVLSERGFSAGEGAYTLQVDFRLEDAPQQDTRFAYARFVITAGLRNRNGAEQFAWSANDREGHASAPEARQRAIRTAEGLIAGAGFAAEFDAWFASLL